MFTKDTEMFLQFPSERGERILHPIVITEAVGDTITARFEEPDVVPHAGQNVLIFFEDGRQFRQQSARVTGVHDADPLIIFAFQTTSEAVSAEGRECYRARAITLDLFCSFGREKRCPIHDVSATGLSVVASALHRIGDNVRVSFSFAGARADGEVCVQSIRELHSGRFRYGLHAMGKDDAAQAFADALARISRSIQDSQQKRMSKAG